MTEHKGVSIMLTRCFGLLTLSLCFDHVNEEVIIVVCSVVAMSVDCFHVILTDWVQMSCLLGCSSAYVRTIEHRQHTL